jgi:hypothetical protein
MRKKTCKSPLKRASRLAFGCLATGASLLFGLTDSASAQVSTGKFSYALQPNGTWNRIEMFHNPGLTYDAAVAAAQGMGGYLFTPRSSTENGAGAGLNGEAWIGLDDVATEGQWKLVDNGETIWTGLGSGAGGGPVAGKYHNWNGAGEPNDAGGEDAAVILNTGRWNDLPNANPGVTRNFIVEFPTGATSQPDPAPGLAHAAVGKWNVRRINGTPDMQHVAAVEMAMYSGLHAGTADYQTSTINFRDQNSGDGYAGGGVFFPGDNPGNADENFFSIYARGRIRIETEGDYTFGFSGDDGAELQIHGQNFLSSSNFGDAGNSNLVRSNIGGFPAHEGDRISYASPTGNGAVVGVVHLTPGDYDLTYKWFENGGGAHAEVFAAPGVHTSFNGAFRPIGHQRGPDVGVLGVTSDGWAVQTTAPGGTPLNNLGQAVTEFITENPPIVVYPNINFNDPQSGGPGRIGGDVPFVGNTGADDEDFALLATAKLVVPVDGIYQIGFQGDDGGEFGFLDPSVEFFQLTQNQTGASVIGPGVFGGVANAITCDCLTGDSSTVGLVALAAGEYDVYAGFWERGGGAYFEVFGGAQGSAMTLISMNGAGVIQDFDGLQLVPEPSSFVLVGIGLVGGFVGLRRRRRS